MWTTVLIRVVLYSWQPALTYLFVLSFIPVLCLPSCHQDEGLRLRKLVVSDTVSSTPAQGSFTVQEAPTNPIPSVVYLIAAVILGLIIGKFLLWEQPNLKTEWKRDILVKTIGYVQSQRRLFVLYFIFVIQCNKLNQQCLECKRNLISAAETSLFNFAECIVVFRKKKVEKDETQLFYRGRNYLQDVLGSKYWLILLVICSSCSLSFYGAATSSFKD